MTDVSRDIPIDIPGGDGSHKIQFMYWDDQDEPFGLIEHHQFQDNGETHAGYVAWRAPKEGSAYRILHTLVSGGPADLEHLTISPSLLCGHRKNVTCTSHGYIIEGQWRDADA